MFSVLEAIAFISWYKLWILNPITTKISNHSLTHSLIHSLNIMSNTHITIRTLLMAATFVGMSITSCKDDDTTTEQENITTVVVHLTGPGFDQEFEWKDLDGDGGNAPVIDEIVVPPLTGNLKCHVHVYDESKSPAVDITEEVEAENTVHLFTFTVSGADFSIVPDDTDDNGAPFNLETVWTTDQPSTGTLQIRLYHDPTDKTNAMNPGGEVDLDVTFPVVIQ